MQKTESPDTQTPDHASAENESSWSERHIDWDRRLKAAGLDGDGPEDRDELRMWFARAVEMFTNAWRGCPEVLCRRYRGCMAPNTLCTNVTSRPIVSPEEEQKIIANFFDEFDEAVDRNEARQAAEAQIAAVLTRHA
jgi:hypothetical protein